MTAWMSPVSDIRLLTQVQTPSPTHQALMGPGDVGGASNWPLTSKKDTGRFCFKFHFQSRLSLTFAVTNHGEEPEVGGHASWAGQEDQGPLLRFHTWVMMPDGSFLRGHVQSAYDGENFISSKENLQTWTVAHTRLWGSSAPGRASEWWRPQGNTWWVTVPSGFLDPWSTATTHCCRQVPGATEHTQDLPEVGIKFLEAFLKEERRDPSTLLPPQHFLWGVGDSAQATEARGDRGKECSQVHRKGQQLPLSMVMYFESPFTERSSPSLVLCAQLHPLEMMTSPLPAEVQVRATAQDREIRNPRR